MMIAFLNKLFGKREVDTLKPIEPCFVQIEPEWIQTDKRVTHGVRGDDVHNEWLKRLEALEARLPEIAHGTVGMGENLLKGYESNQGRLDSHELAMREIIAAVDIMRVQLRKLESAVLELQRHKENDHA